MLTIYGVYRSRASRNIWLAHELGVPFKHVPVIQHYRLPDAKAADAPLHTRSPAFMKVNPNGHVPSIDDDGLVLHELLAINLTSPRSTAARWRPPISPRMARWACGRCGRRPRSSRIRSTCFYHRIGNRQGAKDAKIADAAVEALNTPFAVLDRALAKDGWLVGGRFTVADINVAEIVRYAQAAPELFDAAPRVKAWLAACQARPAFRKMWETREKEPA